MPAEQLVLPTAAPPDKGEFEAARLTGKHLYFFYPQIMHREWQDRAFWKMQAGP